MLPVEEPRSGEANHPLAPRMAVIAFLNQNITIACVWGSFSVLLLSVEARLGIGRELSTLAVLLVNLVTAICAPIVGILATRHSLRLVMLAGTLASLAGFVLLALTASYPLYLLAYALLLGPGMAVGAVLPATLVTRWYAANRGRTLGIVNAPIVIALVPLAANWSLQAYGVAGTYGLLAALSLVTVLANLFVVDRPPGSQFASSAAGGIGEAPKATAGSAVTMVGLVSSPRFLAPALAFIASTSGSIVITAHMVPMARAWGISATLAATLLTIQSSAGIAGTLLFGWVADRIGGRLALAIIAFDGALLWLLLLSHPPFALLAVIVGLIGVHGAGILPAVGVALSERFGREGFSRAYGLVNLVNLPFAVVAVPAAGLVFARTGSYAGAIVGVAALLLLAALFVLAVRPRPAATTQPSHLESRPK